QGSVANGPRLAPTRRPPMSPSARHQVSEKLDSLAEDKSLPFTNARKPGRRGNRGAASFHGSSPPRPGPATTRKEGRSSCRDPEPGPGPDSGQSGSNAARPPDRTRSELRHRSAGPAWSHPPDGDLRRAGRARGPGAPTALARFGPTTPKHLREVPLALRWRHQLQCCRTCLSSERLPPAAGGRVPRRLPDLPAPDQRLD